MQNKHVAYTYQELLDEGGLYLSSTNLEQRKKKKSVREEWLLQKCGVYNKKLSFRNNLVETKSNPFSYEGFQYST